MTEDNRPTPDLQPAKEYTHREERKGDEHRRSPLSVPELRKEARELSQSRRGLFPKVLLLNALLVLPSLALYAVSVLNFTSDSISYIFFQIAAVLLPVILGGPFALGLSSGFLGLSRGEGKIRTASLFYGLKDRYFPRAFGAFLLTVLVSAAALCLLLLPGTALYVYNENRVVPSYGILTLAAVLLLAGGICALLILLRFSLTFWFMAEDRERGPIASIAAGFRAMRGNCIRYLLLMLSYIGRYLAALAGALIAVLIFALAGYSRVSSMDTLFDQYAYLVYLVFYIRIFFVAALTVALSAAAPGPLLASAVFFNRVTGYRPPEPECEAEPSQTPPPEPDAGAGEHTEYSAASRTPSSKETSSETGADTKSSADTKNADTENTENRKNSRGVWPPKPDRADLPVSRTVWENRDENH